ncbi:hypothetical protein KO489_13535 [Reinekea forsetii]|nr:hypothetical protein [Reinekea forsetii]
MAKFKLFLCSLIVVFSAGCSTLSGRDYSVPLLLNPVVFSDRVEVSVMSHGCTTEDDFYLLVKGDKVTLRQIKPDLCRAAPSLIRLSFHYRFGDSLITFKNDVRYMNRVQTR